MEEWIAAKTAQKAQAEERIEFAISSIEWEGREPDRWECASIVDERSTEGRTR
jgi:hypothetical protein